VTTAIPLPKGITGVSTMPKTRELLVNLYPGQDGLARTPGLDLLTTVATQGCRGAGSWYLTGDAFYVIGTTLYRLDAALNMNVVGTIPGSARCFFAGGQTAIVIIVEGGPGYSFSIYGLQPFSDPDFLPSRSVDYMDGRFVFIPSDGSPAFYTEIDDIGQIGALSFFDAEELPDKNRYCFNVSNELHILGTDSSERFRSTGDKDSPFARREGARVDVGYVSGCIGYQTTFAFIGRRRDQSYIICAMGSGSVVELSNERICEIINQYTAAQLEAATVDSFTWNNSIFLTWTIGDVTLTFVNGTWIYQDSNIDTTEIGPWRARGICFAYGRYYAADRTTGQIGKLSRLPYEYGESIEYMLQTFVRGPRDAYFSVPSLEIDSLTGQGPASIGLSLSRDARNWSDYHYHTLGDVGEYDLRVFWGGGLGLYETFMGIRLRGTGQVQFSLEGMQAEIE
jgi:hypothetical protein